jgi:hypothetical protein
MALEFSLVDTWDDGPRIHVSGLVTVWMDGSMDGLAGYDYVFYPGATTNAGEARIFQQEAAAGSS